MVLRHDLTKPAVARFRFAMLSAVGRVRAGNEDFCAATPGTGVFVVCDGMGGAAAGEVASRLAAEAFLDRVNAELAAAGSDAAEPLLQMAVDAANTAVLRRARMESGKRGMGTTLVALLLEAVTADRGPSLWVTHVGDSRCYRWRAGALDSLTLDHSLVQEQILAGQITPEQAERSPVRNVITRAVGSGAEVRAEIRPLSPQAGDVYLLCSDGLTRELPDAALARLLAQTGVAEGGDLQEACAALIGAANAAGGRDNVTALLLRIGDQALVTSRGDPPEKGLH